MAYTLAQANALLAEVTTPDQLRALIAQLDISTSGSVTVFYSGGDGAFSSGDVARAMAAQGSDVRVLDSSEAAKFLDVRDGGNVAFRNKLRALFDDDPLEQGSASNKFLFGGRDASGRRVPDGAWDLTSSRFAAEAVGEVRTITGFAATDGVFAQTELAALLENQKVTHIDGIARADLVRIRDSLGLEYVKHTISANSLQQIHFTGLTATSFDAYLADTPDDLAKQMEDPAKLKGFNELLDRLKQSDPEKLVNYESGVSAIRQGGELAALHGVPKGLNRLGLIGGLLGFTLAANSAAAAESAGDHDGAKEIMTLWAVDSAGSEVGSIVGGVVGGIAVAALAAVGVVTAPLAGALVFGAVLIGGIFGGNVATELYELTKDKDANGKRDIVDRLSNLFYGAHYTIGSPLPPDLLSGVPLTLDRTFSRAEMVANAKADIAWRYALRELNPFVILGVDYSRHNTDGSLELYNPQTREGSMTELYLQDRAAMLTWRIKFDQEHHPYNQPMSAPDIEGTYDFVDLKRQLPGRDGPLTLTIEGDGSGFSHHQIMFGTPSGEELYGGGEADHLYGMGGDDYLSGKEEDDYIEGGAGNDELIGGHGRDQLHGGTGNDILDGGVYADVLEGGKGFDRYHVEEDDTIEDSDDYGTIYLGNDAVQLVGGSQPDEWKYTNLYRSPDGEVVYKENPDGRIDFFGYADPGHVLAPNGPRSGTGQYGDQYVGGDPGLGIPLVKDTSPDDPTRQPMVNVPFMAAQRGVVRRDPLTFDLDGRS